jgi:hypothetical protein
MNYPVLDAIGRADVEAAYGPLMALPTAILVGRDGRICSRHVGLTPLEQFAAEIEALL